MPWYRSCIQAAVCFSRCNHCADTIRISHDTAGAGMLCILECDTYWFVPVYNGSHVSIEIRMRQPAHGLRQHRRSASGHKPPQSALPLHESVLNKTEVEIADQLHLDRRQSGSTRCPETTRSQSLSPMLSGTRMKTKHDSCKLVYQCSVVDVDSVDWICSIIHRRLKI